MLKLHSTYLRNAALATVLTACTEKGETGDASTGDTDATGSTSTGTTAEEPTGTTAGTSTGSSTEEPTGSSTDASTGEPPVDMFGFTCVQLSRGEGFEQDPFVGTDSVVVTLDYGPCLRDYYLMKHPEMRQDGPEGAAVFADWQERLCALELPGRAECEVKALQQILDDGVEEYALQVQHTIPAGGELEGRKLLWGPGPLPAFAECEDGQSASAQLSNLTGVIGLDADASVIWQVQSFGESSGVMGLTGAGCIEVQVAPAG